MDAQQIGIIASIVVIIGGVFAAMKCGKSFIKKIWHYFSRYKPKIPRETVRVVPQVRGCRWDSGTVSGEQAMHVVGQWHVTNISENPIRLLNARLRKPPTDAYFITHNPILPGDTTGISSDFWVIPPVKKVGENFKSTVFLVDQYGNEHKIRNVIFTGPQPEKTVEKIQSEILHKIKDPIEKNVAAVLKSEVNRYKECGRRVGGLGSIQTTFGGQTDVGVGTEWRKTESPRNQSIILNEDTVTITSDNAQALINLHNSLADDSEKQKFYEALLNRLSRDTEYAPVGYLILFVMFQLGKLEETLQKARKDLIDDGKYGFSDFLRLLDGLLRFRHSSFTPDMLDMVDRFIEGISEHTYRIDERLAAIRAFRLSPEN